MYQSIREYSVKQGLTRRKYRCQRQIAGYIVLQADGTYKTFESIPKKERIKKECPDSGKFYTSGMASPVCDKKGTILGEKKHASWIELMNDGSKECKRFEAVNKFIDMYDSDEKFAAQINADINSIKDDEFLSFRVDGKNLEDDLSWVNWFDHIMDEKCTSKTDEYIGISSITGEKSPLIAGDDKLPMCKGGMFGTGVPLYSNSHKKQSGEACSFRSYGEGTESCAISYEDAEVVAAGLEYLANSGHNRLEQFDIMYWYDDETVPDIIDEAIRFKAEKKEEKYKELVDKVLIGQTVEERRNANKNQYHMLQYDVTKGRFRLRNEKTASYGDLWISLKQWYLDTMWHMSNGSDEPITQIYSVFGSLVRKKDANDRNQQINNEFGSAKTELLMAVFEGKQIPRVLYEHALVQVNFSMVYNYIRTDDKTIKTKYSPVTAYKIIKAYLIREGIDMHEQLDNTNSNIGYLCGRWLATIDKLQERASDRKLNKTIGQKMYGSFIKSPAKVANVLNKNRINYLRKLKSERQRVYFERIFAEIAESFPTKEFPEKLSVLEQGAFDLGYAHQMGIFLKKKEDAINSEIENEVNA